ncbi:MAG: hypothetical protein ACKOQ8_05520 [Micrococcales bacterium]
MAIIPTADEVNTFHLNSDKDSAASALHHTLGIGQNQASPGNHNHDGKNSARIDFNDLLNAGVNLDGGLPNTNYGGGGTIDGGGV